MAEKKLAPKPETKEEVFKHSAAIHIENNITLLQRKTWNALLWNAYDGMLRDEVHSISVQELTRLVGYDSHNQEYLKETTKAMLRCIVEWDVLDKDGSPDWGATALLAQVRIQRGICTYAYSPELRQRLHNPSMYARLDLGLQRQFESKYALALWELCADSLGSKRDYGETRWIALEDFRRLMGLEKGAYQDFRDLSKRVISAAVAEVNRVSDFLLTVNYQRKGRKITALKFKMQRVALLPEPEHTQPPLFPDLDNMPLVVKELKDAGLSTQDALEIWQKGFNFVVESVRPPSPAEDADAAFRDYVREKIHLLKRRLAAGKVENSTGFLREAVRHNYANPEFTQAKTERAAGRKRKDNVLVQKQLLERQLDDLRQECRVAVDAVCDAIAAEAPHVLEAALPAVLAASPMLRTFYQANQSSLDNYRASPTLAGMLYQSLEAHDPARIQAVKEPYEARLAALEARLATLNG